MIGTWGEKITPRGVNRFARIRYSVGEFSRYINISSKS